MLARAQCAEGTERVALLDSLGLDEYADPASLREMLSRVLVAARIDTFGCGRMQHKYEQCGTGRFFATGSNLQSAPNIIKRVALHGLWQYDFANCHLTILYQLADRAGIACPTLLDYVKNKQPIRQAVADRVGISVEQAKTCLLKVTYGAKASLRLVDAIPSEIGVSRARIFYRDSFVVKLKKELVAVRDALLANWPQEGGVILNALGLPCSAKARPAERLAHILQGIEAQALLAAVGSLPGQIVLLEHDGFVMRNPIDVPATMRVVSKATGFKLTIEELRLSLPRGIDIRPQNHRRSLRNGVFSSPFATDSRSFSAKITEGCVL